LLAAAAIASLPACAHQHTLEQPASVRFFTEVREMLAIGEPSPEYYSARTRLEDMGTEVDAVLVAIARDPEGRPVARSNALMMLADRRSPAALPVLRQTLLTEESEAQRAAAVLALQRMIPDTPGAVNLIRSAVGDPARTVRLNALQALDIRDVETIRAVLEVETDPDVRRVAIQLVSLAEARGAPLATDRRGALRTAGTETDPQIVFRPAAVDSTADLSRGDLRVELPSAPDLPLAPMAEVVAGVVPAYFSPDRSRVAYEVDREIRIVDLRSRSTRSLGSGIAPRPLPFSQDFIFLRPLLTAPRQADGRTELTYAVYQASFDGEVTHIGELQALARPDLHGNYSPVRWMVVGETSEGFILRGEGISTFKLPSPVWNPAQASDGSQR
jgi:hypothetical protein